MLPRIVRAPVILALLALALAAGSLRPERVGDRLQVALPLLAWACAANRGEAAEYLLRYGVMFVSAHGAKQGLGGAQMNRRPNGGAEGFPSAHTSTAVLGASRLASDCLALHPLGQAAVVFAAAFVGGSRIEAGKHDIWQVLAGALLGLACDRALRRPTPVRARVARGLGRVAAWLARLAAAARAQAGPLARSARRQLAGGALAVAAAIAAATAVRGQDREIGVYLGAQSAMASTVRADDPVLGPLRFSAHWDGNPFVMPPYWGLRATWWQPSGWGFGVELNHAKVYADDVTLAASGFSVLEMTDGLNLLTVNAWRRFKGEGRLTPYLGAGIGLAVPHVEVTSPAGRTFGYEVTGPAVVWMAGVSYDLSGRWALFAEYKGSHSRHDAALDPGGSLKTDITTHALNVGVTWRF